MALNMSQSHLHYKRTQLMINNKVKLENLLFEKHNLVKRELKIGIENREKNVIL